MKLTPEQQKALVEAAGPLLKWLNDNCHPHCKAIIETDRVTLEETVFSAPNNQFVKD